MRASALFVYPKDSFLDWVKDISASDILKRKPEDIYFSEESPVWLIPSLGTFDSDDHLRTYINSLKPKLLLAEINSVSRDAADFEPINAETFDKYFTLELRATVVEIDKLS